MKADGLSTKKADADQVAKLEAEVARLTKKAEADRLAKGKAEAERVAKIEVELHEVITHHA